MAGLDRADCFAAPRASGAKSCGAVAIHVADDRGNFFGLQMAHLLERTKADRPCPGWSRSGLFLSVARGGRGKISMLAYAPKLDGFKPSSFEWAHVCSA